MTDSPTRICPWCSTPIPSGAAACPKCGAAVEGADVGQIPGVTVSNSKAPLRPGEGLVPDGVDPHAWFAAGRNSAPVDEEAFRPPSEAVRLEMRKIELETQLANAGGSVMNPTGDEARNVGQPSQEAIDALKAGLLNETAPAAETNPEQHPAE
jgi:hypothetical protein